MEQPHVFRGLNTAAGSSSQPRAGALLYNICICFPAVFFLNLLDCIRYVISGLSQNKKNFQIVILGLEEGRKGAECQSSNQSTFISGALTHNQPIPPDWFKVKQNLKI